MKKLLIAVGVVALAVTLASLPRPQDIRTARAAGTATPSPVASSARTEPMPSPVASPSPVAVGSAPAASPTAQPTAPPASAASQPATPLLTCKFYGFTGTSWGDWTPSTVAAWRGKTLQFENRRPVINTLTVQLDSLAPTTVSLAPWGDSMHANPVIRIPANAQHVNTSGSGDGIAIYVCG